MRPEVNTQNTLKDMTVLNSANEVRTMYTQDNVMILSMEELMVMT